MKGTLIKHLLDKAQHDSVNLGKIEQGEKASSHRESNPGQLWLEPPMFCH